VNMPLGQIIKGAALALLLLSAAACGGGCWDRMEIESIAFINAVGIDRAGDGNLLVTYYVVNPDALGKKGGGGASSAAIVTSVEARDLALALARYAEQSPRLPQFKQLQSIIIGEDLARQGVGPVLDYFTRRQEMRRSIWVLVAKGKARDILAKGQSPPEKLVSSGIKSILERRPAQTATRYPVVLGDFCSDVGRPGMEPIASSVELVPQQEGAPGGPSGSGPSGGPSGSGPSGGLSGGSSGGSSGGGGSSAAGENKIIALRGAGVFRDEKLLDFLSPDETRGVLWVQGKVNGGRIVVPASGQGDWACLAIERESTNVKPVVEAGRIRFTIDIREQGYILSVDNEKIAAGSKETIELLEREKEAVIRQEAMGAVTKARSLQSDFLGLGDRLYRQHPGVWKQVRDSWNTAWLPQVAVDVNVTCQLRNTKATNDPLNNSTNEKGAVAEKG